MVSRDNGHTLVEIVVILVILGALAFIAVPSLRYSAIHRKQVDMVARRIVTDLRRTRRLAISNAATNTDGFAFKRVDSTFEIEDLSDSTTVDNSAFTVDASITCLGGTNFEFGPLGNLKIGSDSMLTVSSGGKSFTIDIITATGSVRCTEN